MTTDLAVLDAAQMAQARLAFSGAKVMLFIGGQLLVMRRDDIPTIPYPNCLDFPGGGREDGETPEATAIRETQEEFGLLLAETQLQFLNLRARPNGQGFGWFFVAQLPEGAEKDVVFGDEGQGWDLIAPQAYADHPDAVPYHAELARAYLAKI